MKKQTLLFDMDDTLIYCNKYFVEVIQAFSALLADWFQDAGVTSKDVKTKQSELDVACIEQYGFAAAHFPQSFLDTYEFFARRHGYQVEDTKRTLVIDLGRSVYEKEVIAFPHMNETLQKLQEDGHQLCLYTGGDAVIQQKKIEQMELRRFFADRIFIEQHKNNEALHRILQTQQFDPTRTWMIGNSIRTDIVPALENGIHTIHIPAEDEWAFNNIDINVKPQGAFLTVQTLSEVPSAIEDYWNSLVD